MHLLKNNEQSTTTIMRTNNKIQLYPMLRLVIALTAGIIAADIIGTCLRPLYWLMAMAVTLAAALLLQKKENLQTLFILVTVMLLGAYMKCDNETELQCKLPTGSQTYKGVIISQPVIKKKTVLFDMLVTECKSFNKPVKIKLCMLRDHRSEKLEIGYGIKALSQLEAPHNYKNAAFDYKRYLLYHGFTAQTFVYRTNWDVESVSLIRLSLITRTRLAAIRFRQCLLDKYKSLAMNGQEYAVIAAMTLGDKSMVSAQTKDVYSISGASHVLALSGLHLGIIYAILSLLTFRRKDWIVGQIMIMLAIWTYTAIVGMTPSVVRSATMLSIYSFISMLRRDSFSLNTLSLTAFVMLLFHPLDLYDVGFQMSFMAVLSILIFYPIISVWWKTDNKVFNWIWQLAAVSIAAQIGTAPLVCYYFGRISCYFLLTNYFVIPAATVVLYFSVALFVCYAFPAIASLIANVLIIIVSGMNTCLSWISTLPGACIDGLSPSLTQIVMVYAIILSVYILQDYVRKLHRLGDYLDNN